MKRRKEQQLPQISDAEWQVMKVLWAKEPLPTNTVVDALTGQTDWKPKTIHTLLSRLVAKGALGFEKEGRTHVFHTLVTAAECEHAASQSFLNRCFDGELAPFLARFVEKEPLTTAEVEELKRILDQNSP